MGERGTKIFFLNKASYWVISLGLLTRSTTFEVSSTTAMGMEGAKVLGLDDTSKLPETRRGLI